MSELTLERIAELRANMPPDCGWHACEDSFREFQQLCDLAERALRAAEPAPAPSTFSRPGVGNTVLDFDAEIAYIDELEARAANAPAPECQHYCNFGAVTKAADGRLSYTCEKCGVVVHTDYYFRETAPPPECPVTPERVRDIARSRSLGWGDKMVDDLNTVVDYLEARR